MFVSDSTHIPPTGTNWPVATFSFIRSKTCGRCSSIHAHCCAEDIAKMKSGLSSIRAVTFDAVLATFRTVSRSGHSQAESMWACPTALTRWALATAGAASCGASTARAAEAVPEMSFRSSVASSARSSARSRFQRRGSPMLSSCMSWTSTSVSCTSSQTCSSNTDSAMWRTW